MKYFFSSLLFAALLTGCKTDNTKILDFPVTRQSHDYSCGPGAVQAVMAYYGEDYRESQLIDSLKTDNNDGTYLKEIVKFFNTQGFRTDIKQKMTVGELIRYIDRNIPVIVLIQAWGDEKDFRNNYRNCWNDGHFVVVIGYTDKNIIFSDPALFTSGYIPIKEFADRWHDVDGDKKTYQVGLAVYGRTPRFAQACLERIK